MDQSQEILLGHAIFASSEYGYHGYSRIALWISNKSYYQLVKLVNGILSAAGSIERLSLVSLAACDTAGLESIRTWQQETGTS